MRRLNLITIISQGLILIQASFATPCFSFTSDESQQQNERLTGTSVTECPSYVYDPRTEGMIGSPEGVKAAVGGPFDVRDKKESLDPYGFACFGACGPSCVAQCRKLPDVVKYYRIKYTDGKSHLKQCTYHISSCRTHAVCLQHDDCYRQADALHFELTKSYENLPQSTRSSPDDPYRMCDAEGLQMGVSPKCIANFMLGSVPDSCWDKSEGRYATLADERPVSDDDFHQMVSQDQGRAVIDYSVEKKWAPLKQWELVKDNLGQSRVAKFEALRPECITRAKRLPTIQELSDIVAKDTSLQSAASCLWSSTGTFNAINGRLAWSTQKVEAVALVPEKECAAICVAK